MDIGLCQRHPLHLMRWSCAFYLESIYVVAYSYCFMFIEPSLPLLDEANLNTLDNIFHVFLNSVSKYFIENFFHPHSPETLVL